MGFSSLKGPLPLREEPPAYDTLWIPGQIRKFFVEFFYWICYNIPISHCKAGFQKGEAYEKSIDPGYD